MNFLKAQFQISEYYGVFNRFIDGGLLFCSLNIKGNYCGDFILDLDKSVKIIENFKIENKFNSFIKLKVEDIEFEQNNDSTEIKYVSKGSIFIKDSYLYIFLKNIEKVDSDLNLELSNSYEIGRIFNLNGNNILNEIESISEQVKLIKSGSNGTSFKPF